MVTLTCKSFARKFLPTSWWWRLRDWRARRFCRTVLKETARNGGLPVTTVDITRLIHEVPVRSLDASGPRLKILFAAPWLITGGADTMIVDWFRNLGDEWAEKYLATTLPRENVWLDKITACAAGIYDLPVLGCRDQEMMTRALGEIITRHDIDILHIMNSTAAYQALPELKRRFPGLKVVAQFHCFDYFPDGRRTGHACDMPPRFDPMIDAYNLEYPQLAVEIRELYPFIPATKFKVIHGRVDYRYYDPDRRSPAPEIADRHLDGALNLLFVGRLDRQKQPLRLLEIAHALMVEGVAFRMHVIGEGNLESQKREFLRKLTDLGLKDQVFWYGEQPLEVLYDWYRIADLLLLTSDWEGVPMVLYQAMAMAVVPVVSAVGGCGELVTPECGRLIRNPSEITDYVAAIREMRDEDRRRQLALAARQRMLEHFSLAQLGREYKEFYRGLML